jgi:hypothetical protein
MASKAHRQTLAAANREVNKAANEKRRADTRERIRQKLDSIDFEAVRARRGISQKPKGQEGNEPKGQGNEPKGQGNEPKAPQADNGNKKELEAKAAGEDARSAGSN